MFACYWSAQRAALRARRRSRAAGAEAHYSTHGAALRSKKSQGHHWQSSAAQGSRASLATESSIFARPARMGHYQRLPPLGNPHRFCSGLVIDSAPSF
jgi:hypothetical protein